VTGWTDAAAYPGAEADPLAYPGSRPERSFLFERGRVCDLGPVPAGERHAVLAVGSNGCPGRLLEKFGPDATIPVLRGTVADSAVVYAARLAGYGAIPATYLPVDGAVSQVWLTLLDGGQLEVMDESEAGYDRAPVPAPFQIEGGGEVTGVTAYLDPAILAPGGEVIRLADFATKRGPGRALDQPEVLALMCDRAGLLPGLPIRERHRRFQADPELRARLVAQLRRDTLAT
jgi:hypothetical protein